MWKLNEVCLRKNDVCGEEPTAVLTIIPAPAPLPGFHSVCVWHRRDTETWRCHFKAVGAYRVILDQLLSHHPPPPPQDVVMEINGTEKHGLPSDSGLPLDRKINMFGHSLYVHFSLGEKGRELHMSGSDPRPWFSKHSHSHSESEGEIFPCRAIFCFFLNVRAIWQRHLSPHWLPRSIQLTWKARQGSSVSLTSSWMSLPKVCTRWKRAVIPDRRSGPFLVKGIW